VLSITALLTSAAALRVSAFKMERFHTFKLLHRKVCTIKLALEVDRIDSKSGLPKLGLSKSRKLKSK